VIAGDVVSRLPAALAANAAPDRLN
jgi:hypothetical protein